MKKVLLSIVLPLVILFSGCSVHMAANQPGYKDTRFLKKGVSRDLVVAELGTPSTTETDDDGNRVEYFVFKQGYGKTTKVLRTLGHGVADFMTLGVWEIIGTPTESTFSGRQVAIKITYDESNKIKDVVYLKGK